jgi:hypothetical protein
MKAATVGVLESITLRDLVERHKQKVAGRADVYAI